MTTGLFAQIKLPLHCGEQVVTLRCEGSCRAAAIFQALDKLGVCGREEPDRPVPILNLGCHRTRDDLGPIEADHHCHVGFQRFPELGFEFGGGGHLNLLSDGERKQNGSRLHLFQFIERSCLGFRQPKAGAALRQCRDVNHPCHARNSPGVRDERAAIGMSDQDRRAADPAKAAFHGGDIAGERIEAVRWSPTS
jgi:hypothetical protein